MELECTISDVDVRCPIDVRLKLQITIYFFGNSSYTTFPVAAHSLASTERERIIQVFLSGQAIMSMKTWLYRRVAFMNIKPILIV